MRNVFGRVVVIGALVVWSCKSTTPPPLRNVDSPAPPMRLSDLEERRSVPNGHGKMECSDPVLRGRYPDDVADRAVHTDARALDVHAGAAASTSGTSDARRRPRRSR